jgi:hypothetical protein
VNRRRAIGLLCALAILVSACGDEPAGDGASTTAASAADASTSTTAATATTGGDGIDPLDDADREDKSGGTETGPAALLTAVRVGRHEGFDRVVFEFRDRVPAWWVDADEGELTGDPSGEPIALDGASRLDVRMAPASGVEFTDEAPGYIEIYTGPDRVPGTGGVVTEVVEVGDFEANLLWAIGLTDAVDFRVLELSDPPRLVIDARNH